MKIFVEINAVLYVRKNYCVYLRALHILKLKNTMKNSVLCSLTALIFLSGCQKAIDAIVEKGSGSSGFVKYTIPQGKQYADKNGYKTVDLSEMKFVVKFDSSAVYQTKLPENQYDINKLYGFSDNDSDHHQYSARFGWGWSGNFLRLFAYVYNKGAVTSKELTVIPIGKEINCSIQVTSSSYLFTVGGVTERLPRMAAAARGKGYQLYPYFGGDETAPHDIHIWIKNLE